MTLPLSYSRLRGSLASLLPLRRASPPVRSSLVHVPCRVFPNTHDPLHRSPKPAALCSYPLALSAEARRAPCLSTLACQPKLAAKRRAKAGGEGRIRTFEAAGATDLQSVAFDRFATSPISTGGRAGANAVDARSVVRICAARDTCRPACRFCLGLPRVSLVLGSRFRRETWSWRRDLNPRPADYKSAALPD